MFESLVLGINWTGPKELIVYAIVIVLIIAAAVYSRRGAVGR